MRSTEELVDPIQGYDAASTDREMGDSTIVFHAPPYFKRVNHPLHRRQDQGFPPVRICLAGCDAGNEKVVEAEAEYIAEMETDEGAGH
ncbi:unnamed protein product [Victoria cruziana]